MPTLVLAGSERAETANGVTDSSVTVSSSANGTSVSTSSNSATTEKQPNLWIMKPVGLSRGRGIEMINDIRYRVTTL
jgi:Tubulin-tyrosine ligase family